MVECGQIISSRNRITFICILSLKLTKKALFLTLQVLGVAHKNCTHSVKDGRESSFPHHKVLLLLSRDKQPLLKAFSLLHVRFLFFFLVPSQIYFFNKSFSYLVHNDKISFAPFCAIEKLITCFVVNSAVG